MAVAGCSAPGTSCTETAESAGEEKGSSDAEEPAKADTKFTEHQNGAVALRMV